MKQVTKIFRKKSLKNVQKIIFPFSVSGQQLDQTQLLSELKQKQQPYNDRDLSNNLKPIMRSKSKTRTQQLNQRIYRQFQYQQDGLYNPTQQKVNGNFTKQSGGKSRSLTTVKKVKFAGMGHKDELSESYRGKSGKKGRSLTKVDSQSIKERSVTKCDSQWLRGRAVEMQKEREKVHKFDAEKIDRTYDHLGKLKKSTKNKTVFSTKFMSTKTLTKQIPSLEIDQQTFQQAKKQFHLRFKQIPTPNSTQQQPFNQAQFNQRKKTPSPKLPRKNLFKPSPHQKRQSPHGHRQTDKQKQIRASADEQLFKVRHQNQDQDNLLIQEPSEESFFSEVNNNGGNEKGVVAGIVGKMFAGEQKLEKIVSKGNDQEDDVEIMTERPFSQEQMLEEHNIASHDKVYFFSSKLSFGGASLFTIERINLKSRHNESFTIEVIIRAYQQTLVQRIVYEKSRRCETFKRLKPVIEQEQQKERLKGELFSELILKKQAQKYRQSIPQSLHLNSEKPLLLRQSQWPSLKTTGTQHPNLHNLSNVTLQPQCHKGNRSSHSSAHFTTVSQECYQSIISYIEKYCHLQITYLGASVKQSTGPAPTLFNQLMKKKHSQMQQTLLQSLNLAQVYYFMIKINTTYYISKSIIIGGTKLKHYLLYEFSNLIRHEKGCIIEEDEELGQDVSKVRRVELVQRIYFRVMALFNDKLNVPWNSDKQKANRDNPTLHPTRSPFKKYTNTRSIPLINALQLCFGTIKNIGLSSPQDEDNISSERLYKITQNNNYRNDVRWQRLEYELSDTMKRERAGNFFQWHGGFDCAVVERKGDGQSMTNKREMFKSSYGQSLQLRQRQNLRLNYSYHISPAFQLTLTLYPSLLRSHRYLIPLHPSIFPLYKLSSAFQQQQFTLLHIPQSPSTSPLLNSFLKKQYLLSILSNLHQCHNPITNSTPFLSLIKNRRYFINVYIPFLLQPNPWNDSKTTILKENIWILIESRVSVKRYMVKMTFEEIFDEMKEYHRLYSDVRSYKRYIDSIRKIKKEMYNIPIDVLKDRIKFFVSKLKLMKKNTYSQFYFIPIKHLVSEASYQASYHQQSSQAPKSSSKLTPSSSFIQTNKSLIISTLSQLQSLLNQQQKSSKSVITKIRLKNFPTYQIYYKTTRKLLPGYFLLMSIYYVPLFDLSEIKVYVTKIKKSFVVAVRKNIEKREYENVVMVLVEWLKDKFFGVIIRRQSEKLSTKYRDFYSKMIKQAESPFISRTRKNKDALLGLSHILNSSMRRPRHQRPYSINQTTFTQLTQQLLSKTFHSHKKNKYIIRLSYPSTSQYIEQPNRKGIDEVINISILKQNCMTIYKFQTTARALLRKNVTHKFNVVQLEYQEKNKPYYILFEEIKILIEDSDQSTYGLLNTFRSYFLNKHYNALTTNNMISMFSINLLAGLGSNNLLSSSSDIHSNSNSNNSSDLNPNRLSLAPTSNNIKNKHTYNFDTQKQLNIKELNSTMYQRYCLFVQQGKFFEVLKVRNKSKKMALSRQDNRRNSSSSEKIERSEQKITVKRRSLKKQSIEAHLPSKEHQNRLKSSLKNPTAYNSSIRHSKTYSKNIVNFRESPQGKHGHRTSLQPQPHNAIKVSSPSHHKIDFILQQPEPYHAASQTSNTSLPQHPSHNPNIQQKIVYMIDKQTQSITQIPSSIEDQGFVINVPFGLYNKKMFKRFFRNILWKESEERKKYAHSSQNSEGSSQISEEQSSRRDFDRQKPRNSASLLGKDRNSMESNKQGYLESHCQIITSNFTISDCRYLFF